MAKSLLVCVEDVDRLHAAVDGFCEELAKTISAKLPAVSLQENRQILKDDALYLTFVQGVEVLQHAGHYAQAGETLTLHRSYETNCGPLSQSPGMSRLKRMRAAARLAIGVEWALTKVRGLKPKNKDEIVASAKDILAKLAKKGLKVTELPIYLQGVLMSMSKPVEDKPVEDKPVEDKPVEDKPVEDAA
jgi:hypothetical protein